MKILTYEEKHIVGTLLNKVKMACCSVYHKNCVDDAGTICPLRSEGDSKYWHCSLYHTEKILRLNEYSDEKKKW